MGWQPPPEQLCVVSAPGQQLAAGQVCPPGRGVGTSSPGPCTLLCEPGAFAGRRRQGWGAGVVLGLCRGRAEDVVGEGAWGDGDGVLLVMMMRERWVPTAAGLLRLLCPGILASTCVLSWHWQWAQGSPGAVQDAELG